MYAHCPAAEIYKIQTEKTTRKWVGIDRPHLWSINLVLLDAPAVIPLRILNRRLIRLDLSRGHSQEALRGLPRPCKIARSRLAKDVDLDQIGLERALDRNNRLDQQRVLVLEPQVHHDHHADAHQLRLELVAQLCAVVLLHRRGDGLGLLAGAERCGLDVFEGGQIYSIPTVSMNTVPFLSLEGGKPTLLLIDYRLHVEIQPKDKYVRRNVQTANPKQDVRVVEWHLLGQLHQSKNKDHVGSVKLPCSQLPSHSPAHCARRQATDT